MFRSKVRWTNYRTGVKDIFLRLHVDSHGCHLSLDLQHNDPGIRALFWEQLCEMRVLIQDAFPQDMIWQVNKKMPNSRELSCLETPRMTGSIHQKNTWPRMLNYLKNNLVAFDAFWFDAFDIFKALEE